MAPTERAKLGLIGPSRSLDVPTRLEAHCSFILTQPSRSNPLRCDSESWATGLCRTLSDFRGRKKNEVPNPKEGLGEEALRRSKRELGGFENISFLSLNDEIGQLAKLPVSCIFLKISPGQDNRLNSW